jgi:hypothetical protein
MKMVVGIFLVAQPLPALVTIIAGWPLQPESQNPWQTGCSPGNHSPFVPAKFRLEFRSIGSIAKKRAANERNSTREIEEFRRKIAAGGAGRSGGASAGGGAAGLPWFHCEGADDESNQHEFSG